MMNKNQFCYNPCFEKQFFPKTNGCIREQFEHNTDLHGYVWFNLWESLSECRKLHTAEPRHLELPKTIMHPEARHGGRNSTHPHLALQLPM